jgi:hypothetical protein
VVFCSDYFKSKKYLEVCTGHLAYWYAFLIVVVSLCTEKENLSRILSTAISEIICAMQNVFKIFSLCRSNFMPSKYGLLCLVNLICSCVWSFPLLWWVAWWRVEGGPVSQSVNNKTCQLYKSQDHGLNRKPQTSAKPQLNTRVNRRVRKIQYQNPEFHPEFHPVFPFS